MKCRWCGKELLPTDGVRARFANKGPLPPPVVDFSTDECPRCGKVLNQCTCPQVLQRVDFNEEFVTANKQLKAENERLKAQLEKAKCCGSCRHGQPLPIDTLRCYSKGTPYLPVGLAGKACDKWEVRE